MTDKAKYIRYTAQHPVPLFFMPYWLDIYHAEWNVIFEKEQNDSAFFIYSIEKKMNFRIIRNGFLTPYSGFFFPDSNIQHQARQMLMIKVFKKLPSFHELHLDLHPGCGTQFAFDDFTVEIKRTNILRIADPENTYNAYRPSLKRQINKAIKTISIHEADDIRLFYRLHEKTFLKQSRRAAIPLKAFEQAWKVCRQHQCGRLLFALDVNENVHAALFLTFDNENAYYLAGGTDAEFYGSGAMSYLMHSAIGLASALGKKYFDFEGSMLPNVNKFFSNFSPEEKQYLSISKMDSLLLKMIKHIKKK